MSCLRPVPDCVIRKICSAPSPGGRAVNTIHCGLRRRPLRLSRGSGDRRQGEPDHDDDHGQHAKPDRRAAPRTCGAAPRVALVALDAVDHLGRTVHSGPRSRRTPRRRRCRAVRPSARSRLVSSAAMRRPRGPASSLVPWWRAQWRSAAIAALIVTQGRARERGADDRAVGADHRHETECPGHRRGDPRRPRSR